MGKQLKIMICGGINCKKQTKIKLLYAPGTTHKGCSHLGERESAKNRQLWMSALKKKIFIFFDDLQIPSVQYIHPVPPNLPPPPQAHTSFTYITTLPQSQILLSNLSVYLYLIGC